ncbi:LOW QUALITY PROTEIN: hypothetical protein TorRG33x02_151590 [Trema orientale]|uniref:Uncharacterized protein n=1 Tax=Trema orientale TaxID=63057 RepID=A0A2P5EU77_TREOI|nr:LOW QUALITY PROTEIN: hypothetical protein TorRG33x02_151590 [Trema orientale]
MVCRIEFTKYPEEARLRSRSTPEPGLHVRLRHLSPWGILSGDGTWKGTPRVRSLLPYDGILGQLLVYH